MMNWFKKLMLFRLLILVIQSKKLTMTQKLVKCNMKKITAHDRSNKYITTQTFNKLTSEDLSARLKLANVKTKSDIDDFNDKFR